MYYEEKFDPMTSTWWYRGTPRGPWNLMPKETVARKLFDLQSAGQADGQPATSTNNEVVDK